MTDRDHRWNPQAVTHAATVVDGNAIAGLLADIFAESVTRITITCGNCGLDGHIEEAVVERDRRCAIVRCRSCTHTLLTIMIGAHGSSHDLSIVGGAILTLSEGGAPGPADSAQRRRT